MGFPSIIFPLLSLTTHTHTHACTKHFFYIHTFKTKCKLKNERGRKFEICGDCKLYYNPHKSKRWMDVMDGTKFNYPNIKSIEKRKRKKKKKKKKKKRAPSEMESKRKKI